MSSSIYLAVGFELLDRLLAWKELQMRATAEGREVNDEDVEKFVLEFERERSLLMAAIARAKAEGR